MVEIDLNLTPAALQPAVTRLWQIAGPKILEIDRSAVEIGGTPVFTVAGRYVAQGWTEWTQGFQFGCALLQFDATDDRTFLELGRHRTLARMAPHVTHIGVHDHGFHQISTYGHLRRLMLEKRLPFNETELQLYGFALQVSGAVQAARWSLTADGDGFIHSFNGPHSLFCDTIRSLRSLGVAHALGHFLWAENDRRVSLLDRLLQHARCTARYNVYYGEGRDIYDQSGRVAHETLFNPTDQTFRCPSTQQGYSPFSTWTRGLAWIILGYAEQLEYLKSRSDSELTPLGGRTLNERLMRRAAQAASDYYLAQTPRCGVPYWDTAAPGLSRLANYLDRPADPFNGFEPVDSSAAAIAAQGLLRLGQYLQSQGAESEGRRYWQAGLSVMRTLLQEPYLCDDTKHQGLLKHVVYHRPRGWDYIPSGAKIPQGESCLWGDYHLMEVALYLQRVVNGEPPYQFFTPETND